MYNLIQNNFDKMTELFIDGKITFNHYNDIQKHFFTNSKLFTICLN